MKEPKSSSSNTMSPEQSKPSLNQKAKQSSDSNRLSPSEIESLKAAAKSFRLKILERDPQAKFVD